MKTNDQERCTFDHNGQGPQCCREPHTVDAPHLFKCAGDRCPGYAWPASVMAHPHTCVTGEPKRKQAGFTLIELMIAIAFVAIILVVVVGGLIVLGHFIIKWW
jgi:prepilin-type N-terminal cleavage/methylation domain-containing protein